MYKIEKKDYGVKLTFSGTMDIAEMKAWLEESKKLLPSITGQFGVFVDMRTLHPIDSATQAVMEEGQSLYKAKGMVRSVVILSNPTTTLQFKRIARQTGIDKWERYIDSSAYPNWEKTGID